MGGEASRCSVVKQAVQPARRGVLEDVDSAAHHELPHHDTEGVDVARVVQAVLPRHLRCHVEGRAAPDVALVACVLAHSHRHAEIDDFGFGVAAVQGCRQARVHTVVKLQRTRL